MDGLVALATSVCLSVHAGERQFRSWLFAREGECGAERYCESFLSPRPHTFWVCFGAGARRDTVVVVAESWSTLTSYLILQSTLTS